MFCPYCHTEYTDEHPCFCHPVLQASPAQEHGDRTAEDQRVSSVAWNSHRGVRLD
jgi:hypothetical protein